MPNCCDGTNLWAMTETQFHDLDRFVAYANKQFELGLLAGCFAGKRVEPDGLLYE